MASTDTCLICGEPIGDKPELTQIIREKDSRVCQVQNYHWKCMWDKEEARLRERREAWKRKEGKNRT